MAHDRNHPSRATRAGSIAAIAGMAFFVLTLAVVMIYSFAGDRPATTSAGFQPVIDEVRPVPGTTGQGGGRDIAR